MLDLYGEKVKIIRARRGVIQRSFFVNERKTKALVLRLTGSVKYTFYPSGEVLKSDVGELIFINSGVSYKVDVLSPNADTYYIIEFETDKELPDYISLSVDDFLLAKSNVERIVKLTALGGKRRELSALARFYELLSISLLFGSDEAKKVKRSEKIRESLNYLEEHIFDPSLTVGKLISLSDISDVSFRSVFKEVMGMSPRQYIISLRMERAKAILESDDSPLVYEVALSVGYADPLYFSRVFKEYFGIAPSFSSANNEVV